MLGISTISDIFRKFFRKTIDKTTLSWYNDDNEKQITYQVQEDEYDDKRAEDSEHHQGHRDGS